MKQLKAVNNETWTKKNAQSCLGIDFVKFTERKSLLKSTNIYALLTG